LAGILFLTALGRLQHLNFQKLSTYCHHKRLIYRPVYTTCTENTCRPFEYTFVLDHTVTLQRRFFFERKGRPQFHYSETKFNMFAPRKTITPATLAIHRYIRYQHYQTHHTAGRCFLQHLLYHQKSKILKFAATLASAVLHFFVPIPAPRFPAPQLPPVCSPASSS
jgi:hypothetical protein